MQNTDYLKKYINKRIRDVPNNKQKTRYEIFQAISKARKYMEHITENKYSIIVVKIRYLELDQDGQSSIQQSLVDDAIIGQKLNPIPIRSRSWQKTLSEVKSTKTSVDFGKIRIDFYKT